MIVIISYEVENFLVQSWNFVQIQFLVFWLENEEYCHSKFLNEEIRNNNLDRDLARNLYKQILRYSFFGQKFESTYFGDTNVLSDSFERQTLFRQRRCLIKKFRSIYLGFYFKIFPQKKNVIGWNLENAALVS